MNSRILSSILTLIAVACSPSSSPVVPVEDGGVDASNRSDGSSPLSEAGPGLEAGSPDTGTIPDAASPPEAGSPPRTEPFIVFVTNPDYYGDLGPALAPPDNTLTGVAKADKICKLLAESSAFDGNKLHNRHWKAWLTGAAANTAPAFRFTSKEPLFASLGYALPDGTVLAASWAALIDSATTPFNPPGFSRKADNTLVNIPGVWTNTLANGEQAGNDHCNDWVDGTGAFRGYRAYTDPVPLNQNWTVGAAKKCNSIHRALYCFEQPQP